MLKALKKFYVAYNVFSKKHMVVANSLQSGILLGGSDFVAQKYVEKVDRVDLLRNVQFIAIGLFFNGPYSSFFFKRLNSFYANSKQSVHRVVVQKVLVDQIFFSPTFVAGMMYLKYFQQGLETEQIRTEFDDKYVDIMVNNYKVWPFLKISMYYFVPLHHQVLYSQTFAFFWNVYVTWKINNNEPFNRTVLAL